MFPRLLPHATRRNGRDLSLILPLIFSLAAGCTQSGGSPRDGSSAYPPAPPLPIERTGHAATLLPDGRVLIAGGVGDAVRHYDALYFDPDLNEWSKAGDILGAAAPIEAALTSDGQVVLVHSSDGFRGMLFETFNPGTGAFSPSSHGIISSWGLYAVGPLADGRVTVSGGYDLGPLPPQVLNLFWVYDPRTDLLLQDAGMSHARQRHTATLLPTGEIMIVGGFDRPDAVARPPVGPCEIYDPRTHSLRLTADLPTPTGDHAAVLLSDGRLLVAGGYRKAATIDDAYVDRVAIFDPSQETWTVAAPLLERRANAQAVSLRDGRVLMVGGVYSSAASGPVQPRATEVYDPAYDAWTPGPTISVGRIAHTATALDDGRVLVAGGARWNGTTYIATDSVDLLGPDFP
ncbi:MAG: hypothetical protein O7H41_13615 [Planctomycetota bacterium]|nr:hypothetical protein [Planctomycetota bacterium]